MKKLLLSLAFVFLAAPVFSGGGSIVPPTLPNLYLVNYTLQSVGTSANQSLSWDTLAYSDGWNSLTLPVTTVTFPTAGLVDIQIFDCDFGDAGSTVGARGMLTQKDTNVLTTRAGAIIAPASLSAGATTNKKSVISYSRTMVVSSTSTLTVYASQNSTGTLSMACVSLAIKYRAVGNIAFPATDF